MRRRQRIAATVLGGAVIAGTMILLTSLGDATEGPLSATLDHLGGAIDTAEHTVREWVSGRSRRRDLDWFAPYRSDVARLRDPQDRLVGAWDSGLPDSLQGVVDLERRVGTVFPLVHVYTAWGDGSDHRFPWRIATSIWNLGSVPVVTWEPWLWAFEPARHPALPLRQDRDLHGLAAVARGDYDFYIDAWSRDAARFGRPLFLRFAHEMNDPYRYPWGPQHNTKEEFIAAWRHVVERFRAAGAHNVLWVWSPHTALEYWDLYYPGETFVDWVATGVLNFGAIAWWSRWWTFDEIFGTKHPRLSAFGKPIMVAEFGSLAVGGDRNAWYQDALDALAERYPDVEALLLFHTASDRTVTPQALDWSIRDPDLARVIAQALEKHRWTHRP